MENLFETDRGVDHAGTATGADRLSSNDTELPYLSRGDHRDAQLPSADNPIWGDHRGAAGDEFVAGVHDPDHLLGPAEKEAAERLAADGAMVSALQVDAPLMGRVEGMAIVRESPTDSGTPTAFVPLDVSSPEAVADAVEVAAERVGDFEHGEVVLDGRDSGLTLEAARAGWNLAADRGGPDKMHVLLADGDRHTFPED
jgi:hypothetical protein